jgi:protein-arginine kinase activator protein McsA
MICTICRKEASIQVSLKDKKTKSEIAVVYLCAKHEKLRVKNNKKFKKLLGKKI